MHEPTSEYQYSSVERQIEEAAVAHGGKQSVFPSKCWFALDQGAVPPASLAGVLRAELSAGAP